MGIFNNLPAGMFSLNPLGGAGAGAYRKAVPNSGTAHTKSAWVAMGTLDDAIDSLLCVVALDENVQMLFDIGIGGAGSEVVLVPDIFIGSHDGTRFTHYFWLPIKLPTGTRLAVRQQNSTTNRALFISFHYIRQGFPRFPTFGRFTSYGVDLANSIGTLVDPGSTANTKGAYSQLVAATANPMKGLLVFVQKDDTANPTQTSTGFLDLAVGGAGSEQIVIPDYPFHNQGNKPLHPAGRFYPCDIPAGTRLAARAASSNTNSNARQVWVAVLGME